MSEIIITKSLETLGQAYITALTTQKLESLKTIFGQQLRFRALVPRRLCEGQSTDEAIEWLRRWFGEADEIQVLQSSAAQVFDRLYLNYRLRVHDVINGWRVIEQHAYLIVQDGQIVDMWLLCSGFRPEGSNVIAPECKWVPPG